MAFMTEKAVQELDFLSYSGQLCMKEGHSQCAVSWMSVLESIYFAKLRPTGLYDSKMLFVANNIV